jgi:hypothetical protein
VTSHTVRMVNTQGKLPVLDCAQIGSGYVGVRLIPLNRDNHRTFLSSLPEVRMHFLPLSGLTPTAVFNSIHSYVHDPHS